MYLTVAICTWNRSALLAQALDQMTHLVTPPDVEWELLVVNNNCTDATDEIIAAFASRLPIRRVFEPKPGQSNARNAAVKEARGDYILWTDDDALVDENWVANYVKAFQRWPAAAFFGGPVLPHFHSPPPAWLTRTWPLVGGAYAMRDLGIDPIPFTGGDCLPFGVNWAIRVSEQRCQSYDSRFGLRPGSAIRGEEVRVMYSLLANGCEGWWVPDAKVRHFIPPERMTIRYIRQFFGGYGKYLAMTVPSSGPTIFGRPRWLWRRTITDELKYRTHRLTSPPEVWIKDLINASMRWGAFFYPH